MISALGCIGVQTEQDEVKMRNDVSKNAVGKGKHQKLLQAGYYDDKWSLLTALRFINLERKRASRLFLEEHNAREQGSASANELAEQRKESDKLVAKYERRIAQANWLQDLRRGVPTLAEILKHGMEKGYPPSKVQGIIQKMRRCFFSQRLLDPSDKMYPYHDAVISEEGMSAVSAALRRWLKKQAEKQAIKDDPTKVRCAGLALRDGKRFPCPEVLQLNEPAAPGEWHLCYSCMDLFNRVQSLYAGDENNGACRFCCKPQLYPEQFEQQLPGERLYLHEASGREVLMDEREASFYVLQPLTHYSGTYACKACLHERRVVAKWLEATKECASQVCSERVYPSRAVEYSKGVYYCSKQCLESSVDHEPCLCCGKPHIIRDEKLQGLCRPCHYKIWGPGGRGYK